MLQRQFKMNATIIVCFKLIFFTPVLKTVKYNRYCRYLTSFMNLVTKRDLEADATFLKKISLTNAILTRCDLCTIYGVWIITYFFLSFFNIFRRHSQAFLSLFQLENSRRSMETVRASSRSLCCSGKEAETPFKVLITTLQCAKIHQKKFSFQTYWCAAGESRAPASARDSGLKSAESERHKPQHVSRFNENLHISLIDRMLIPLMSRWAWLGGLGVSWGTGTDTRERWGWKGTPCCKRNSPEAEEQPPHPRKTPASAAERTHRQSLL